MTPTLVSKSAEAFCVPILTVNSTTQTTFYLLTDSLHITCVKWCGLSSLVPIKWIYYHYDYHTLSCCKWKYNAKTLFICYVWPD